MTKNVNKFKIEELIKISCFKHRGNLTEVSKEVGMPLNYVKSVYEKKIRKREQRDVATLISNTLMQHLFVGYQQRIVYIDELMKSLEKQETAMVSDVSMAPMRYEIDERTRSVRLICSVTGKPCQPVRVNKESIFHLKMEIVDKFREEDDALLKFVERMGYVGGDKEPPKPVVFKQNFLMVDGGDTRRKTIEEEKTLDATFVKEAENMHPNERQKVINKLTNHVIEMSKKGIVEK